MSALKNKKHQISKSQFIKGHQCEKALWIYRNAKELHDAADELNQALLSSGEEIGKMARTLYPKGVLVESEYWAMEKAQKLTNDFIKSGEDVIFEAMAIGDEGIYSSIDMLRKVKGKKQWDLIEVKGATKVKDYYIVDMAFQRCVFESAGYEIRKSILVHINIDYVREGKIDPKKLFNEVDCTDDVKAIQNEVKGKIPQLLKVLKKKTMPSIEIGSHCNSPFSCEYQSHCWKHVPEYSVYDVTSGKKLEELLNKGILHINKIPKDFKFSDTKSIDVNSFKSKKLHADKKSIKQWVSALKYPIVYLDYETINPAIPLFDLSSPYEQLPFQFSVHIQKKENGPVKTLNYLHKLPTDPRPSVIEALIQACEDAGNVVVYYQQFEEGVNKRLADYSPKHKTKLLKINEKMVDLLVPFKSRALYHPEQQGSASLKDVLPAFVPSMTYEGMNISNGGDASRMGHLILSGQLEQEQLTEAFRNLEEYCHQDTLAMVKLVEVLYSHS